MNAVTVITVAIIIADIKVDCPKCGGQGTLDGYAHIQHGVCFRCNGAGKVYLTTLPEKYHDPYIREAQEKAERKAAHDAAQTQYDAIADMIQAGVEMEMGPWFDGEPDEDGLVDPFSINWKVNDEIKNRMDKAQESGLLPTIPEL